MKALEPLTRRQREVLVFITESTRVNGYAPSLEEIARALNLFALATVHKHLTNLEIKGYIRRVWNQSRSIQLLVQEGCCPTCGRPVAVDLTDAVATAPEGV